MFRQFLRFGPQGWTQMVDRRFYWGMVRVVVGRGWAGCRVGWGLFPRRPRECRWHGCWGCGMVWNLEPVMELKALDKTGLMMETWYIGCTFRARGNLSLTTNRLMIGSISYGPENCGVKLLDSAWSRRSLEKKPHLFSGLLSGSRNLAPLVLTPLKSISAQERSGRVRCLVRNRTL